MSVETIIETETQPELVIESVGPRGGMGPAGADQAALFQLGVANLRLNRLTAGAETSTSFLHEATRLPPQPHDLCGA